MAQSVCILGRQPALGLAELESLLRAGNLSSLGSNAALLEVDANEVPFSRLGGTIKLAKMLTILDTNDWHKIEDYLVNSVVPHTDYLPPGKMDLGLSIYGLSVNPARINATALSLKKVIRAHGRSVRVIPNKTTDLSSAQVLHNDLTGARGWELLFIKHGSQTYIAQTVAVQDINAYAARDQRRPKRDARVGMLPPKLAQIIVNLANPPAGGTVLDPFCGTGVLLQEALLMGMNAYGTDIEPRMVEYTEDNLQWLAQNFRVNGGNYRVSVGDATNFTWQKPYDAIAAEIYLGRPFSAEPRPEMLNEVIGDVDTIHKKFLKNIARQTETDFKMALAVPAWKTKNGFRHLPTLDHLEEIGYTRQSLIHAPNEDLIYHRPEQVVGRELVTLIRK